MPLYFLFLARGLVLTPRGIRLEDDIFAANLLNGREALPDEAVDDFSRGISEIEIEPETRRC